MNERTGYTGGTPLRLKDIDPKSTGSTARADAESSTQELLKELAELQDLLYAAQDTAVLIVLQGLDTSGKDGSIQHVMGVMNPQSCRVASFKVPTPVESAHDFLWRIHAETPGRGGITIFNRSHYEDVLVVRVHKQITVNEVKSRFTTINAFEKLLADSGTIILKFFLHITKDEQERRLLDRENDPTKAWKLSAADWKERELWDEYQVAYEDAILTCAAPHAPWYIVPADHKWYRNYFIAETLVKTLRPSRAAWVKRIETIGAAELQRLRAQRQIH
jgi:PPK2 family polyphosphate:nucleotide phosphotransferase